MTIRQKGFNAVNGKQFLAWLNQAVMVDLDAHLQPLVMGVLNVTPDSFSDGGRYFDSKRAMARALEMIDEGVSLIDIGGESTKPGAVDVSCDEELSRVIPVIERIRAESDICISIDTSKPQVMQAAVAAGANAINDVSALTRDNSLSIAAALKVPVFLMHRQGSPRTMQLMPTYEHGIINEINQFFQARIAACEQHGMDRNLLILDPGFGFGKSVSHNLHLLKHVDEFKCHGLPLALGVSRKNTLGVLLNQPESGRLHGGIAMAVYAVHHGVNIIRTHDIRETQQALQVIHAITQDHTLHGQ